MTIHDEILRLRDVVRRVADELKIDTARALADDALARPMPQWQGLTDDDRRVIWQRFLDSPRAARMFKTMHAAEEAVRRKNGF